MAIYHFSGKIVSRSQGRSAVACSAYRSGTCLKDERTDITHDYTRKQDVLHADILLPDNAIAWMGDRETLWNRVEAGEKRKDAQLARDIHFSLPRELTNEQNIALAREFVQTEFVNRGMVADLAVHNHAGADGEMQPHAHVMLTLRDITLEGFGQKDRSWNDKALLMHFREAWAEMANHHLALHGHDQRIDHRSNKEQGIDLEPQHKIGAVASQDKSARLADHERIARENGERILENPTVALDAITRQQSTFTHHDLARFVNRHTVDAAQFQRVFDAVRASPELVLLGNDEKGRERFSTHSMIALESRLVGQADEMNHRLDHHVSAATQADVLSRYTLSDQQRDAFHHLTSRGDIKSVIGYAGTGKSYLLGAAREAWEKAGYRVHGVALAGIAAQNLEHSAGIASRTVASREYYWDKGQQGLTCRDILVVDEAGMLGSRQLARILNEAHKSNTKVVLVGDPQQLQSIEAGAAFRAVLERAHYVELTDIRRQREAWQQQATKELARGDVEIAIDRYRQHDNVHDYDTPAQATQALVSLWNEARISHPNDTQIMMAYTRKDVGDLNRLGRELRAGLGELGRDHTIQTERGERLFAPQDRLYFLRNDRGMGVMNGTLGTIQTIDAQRHKMTVILDANEREPAPRTVTVDLDNYAHIDHGYAATVHKGQGVTVDRGYLLASRYLDAHATYVGLSRHRESVDIFWSTDDFKNEQDLARTLGRERHKDMTIDYGLQGGQVEAFATHRGLNLDEPLHTEKQVNQDRAANAFLHQQETLQRDRDKADLHAFMDNFQKNNPEKAEKINDALRPEKEQAGISALREWEKLHRDHGAALRAGLGDLSGAKSAYTQFVTATRNDKEAMDFLKEKHPTVAKHIEDIGKTYDKVMDDQKQAEKSRGMSRGGRSREHSRERGHGIER